MGHKIYTSDLGEYRIINSNVPELIEELDEDTDAPTPLMPISGDIRLVADGESHSEGILSDNIPRLSLPKDNLVGGAILVGGNSLSSGTTGVALDMSMDEENEFFANRR